MKTLLHLSFVVLAAAVPLSVAAEFAGWAVPVALNPVSVFSWFTVSSLLLVMAADYRRLQTVEAGVRHPSGGTKNAQAEHPLAA